MQYSNHNERRNNLIITALILSLIMHMSGMFALRTYSFTTIAGEIKASRKWTRDVPKMQINHLTGDPMSKDINASGRPAAAPEVKDEATKVQDLATEPMTTLTATLPDSPNATPIKNETPPDIPPEALQPRAEVLTINHPNAPDAETVITPVKTSSSIAVPSSSPDIIPPFTMPSPQNGESITTTLSVATLPPPTPPELELPPAPNISFATPNDPFGLGAREAAKKLATNPSKEDETANAVISNAPTADTDKNFSLPKVDEAVVRKQQQQIKQLRDDKEGKSFADNVQMGLEFWIDPQQPTLKYFRLNIASRAAKPLPTIPKDVVFLLDASGSIANDRLRSCRNAITDALRKLNPNDRFNIVTFRNDFHYAFNTWQNATEAGFAQADKWLSHVYARGYTDVFKTMRSILSLPRTPERPMIALVITDGEATAGMTRSAEIISSFAELNSGLVSIYMYGVKKEANDYLMDMVTRSSRGEWMKFDGFRLNAGRDIAKITHKFATPLLSDLSITFAAACHTDTYPQLVANLYDESPVTIYGVCPASCKELVFVARGLNGKDSYENLFKLPFGNIATLGPETKILWAQRRLYAMVQNYTMHPEPQLLRDIKIFAKKHNVSVPYEEELK